MWSLAPPGFTGNPWGLEFCPTDAIRNACLFDGPSVLCAVLADVPFPLAPLPPPPPPCRLEGICLQRWGRMQEQVRLCYPGIALQPPVEELRRMFQAAAKAHG